MLRAAEASMIRPDPASISDGSSSRGDGSQTSDGRATNGKRGGGTIRSDAKSGDACAKPGSKSACCKGPGYATPLDAFRQGPREKLLYTACTYVSTGHDSADYLATVDCDPESPTYSSVISRVYGTAPGDELHHFAWSACASCHDDPSKERRFLVVPGLASARIYIIDTRDERAPKLHKVIEPEEIARKTNLTAGHTTHCLADGTVMIAMLGEGDGAAPGGYLLLDDEFNVKGRWEAQGKGVVQQTYGYDFWYQPSHNVMLSSGWGAPSTFAPGFDPADVAAGKYSKEIHIWDWTRREIVARVDLDDSGWLPLELRFHHDPDSTHAFVGAALGSSIWHIYLDEPRDEWVFEKIVQVAPVGERPGFPNDEMPGLVTDLLLSMDDRYMYFSCWLHGDVRQYDISDPSRPVLTGRVVVGGLLGSGATVRGNTIVGGPQMLQLSLDGKRLYVTTSLYSTWDNQFFPSMQEAGGCMFMIDVDHANGGMALNQSFFVDFGREPRGASRCHETRYPGGDCTSDIYVSHKRKTWDKPPTARHRIHKLDLSYQHAYEVQAHGGAGSLAMDRGLPAELVVRIGGSGGSGGPSGEPLREIRISPGASFERFKVAVQEAVGRVSVLRYDGHVLRTEADKQAAVVDAVVRGRTALLVTAEDAGRSRDHLPPFGVATGRGRTVEDAYRRVEFSLGTAPDVMLVHVAGAGAARDALRALQRLAPGVPVHGIAVADGEPDLSFAAEGVADDAANTEPNNVPLASASASASGTGSGKGADGSQTGSSGRRKVRKSPGPGGAAPSRASSGRAGGKGKQRDANRVSIFGVFDAGKGKCSVGLCKDAAGDPRGATGSAVRQALIAVGFSPAMLRTKPSLVIVSGRYGQSAEVIAGITDTLGFHVPVIGGVHRAQNAVPFGAVPHRTGGAGAAVVAAQSHTEVDIVVTLLFADRPISTAGAAQAPLTSHTAVVTASDGAGSIESLDGRAAAKVFDEWTAGLVDLVPSGASTGSAGKIKIDPQTVPGSTDRRNAALFPLLVATAPDAGTGGSDRIARRDGNAISVGVSVPVGTVVGLCAATRDTLLANVPGTLSIALGALTAASGTAAGALGFVPIAVAAGTTPATMASRIVEPSRDAAGPGVALLGIPVDDVIAFGLQRGGLSAEFCFFFKKKQYCYFRNS
jgi:selenium-binding protein 1